VVARVEILRYAAFSTTPDGGNPAGVVLDARGVDGDEMLATAAGVGYSETAFVTGADGDVLDVRYFSPLMEVPFCGHATIATAVAHARRHGVGTLRLRTRAGQVVVSTADDDLGNMVATLVSVAPRSVAIDAADLAALLGALRWSADDLDPAFPVAAAFAGAWHPIIAAGTRARLSELDYDMASLGDLMRARDWTTVDLVWRESGTVFHARNPFPPGGVREDPATGAAAAAFGGYLREHGLVEPPCAVTVHQGDDMGRPSVITVAITPDPGDGIAVSGAAVELVEYPTR
jgi:PhzF family phenazine biosynthesis protein